MGNPSAKRKLDGKVRAPPAKKFKKQKHYSSGSESEGEGAARDAPRSSRPHKPSQARAFRERNGVAGPEKQQPKAEAVAPKLSAEDTVDDEEIVELEESTAGSSSGEEVAANEEEALEKIEAIVSTSLPPAESADGTAEKHISAITTDGLVEDGDDDEVEDDDESDENEKGGDEEDEEEDEEDDDDIDNDDLSVSSQSSGSTTTRRTKSKRHDPSAFASSISAILSSKLTTSKRSDPVLSRSRTAAEASHSISESKLEARAKRKLKEEKRQAAEKGRIKDVLLGDRSDAMNLDLAGDDGIDEGTGVGTGGKSAADIARGERRLRKIAQEGVVKMFNAFRAAQVAAEKAQREQREGGVVGSKRREEKVGEMARDAFLARVGGGG